MREAYAADSSWAVSGGTLVVRGEVGVSADAAGWGGIPGYMVVPKFLTFVALYCAVIWACFIHSALLVKEKNVVSSRVSTLP